MKLSICIVNFNSGTLLEKCLDSIQRFPPNCDYETIVVDNNSMDGSQTTALKRKRVILIQNGRNDGFAMANNQIFDMAQGEYYLMLNADTEVRNGALNALLGCADANPVAGLISAKLVNPDGTTQVGFNVRCFPRMATAVAQLLLFDEIWPRNPLTRSAGCFDMDYTQAQKVEQPAASALLYRRTAWEKIGGFDEQFLNWYNDVDLCRRVKEGGWDILYCPKSEIMHYGGMSAVSLDMTAGLVESYRSQRLYFLKHNGRFSYWTLNLSIATGMLARILTLQFWPGIENKINFKARRDRTGAAIKAFLEVFRDTFKTWNSLSDKRNLAREF